MEEISRIDSQKLMYHPQRVSQWMDKGDCYPLYVEIGPTRACNHHCVFCSLDWVNRKRVDINTEVMNLALEDMADIGVKAVMFAGVGEALLHKDIGLFCEKAKKTGMDVSITSNGVVFNQKKRESCLPTLSWIKFSIDSGSPENYAIVHGTVQEDFNRLIENIKESVKFREKYNLPVVIGGQFIDIPQNKGEAVKLAEILKNIGADYLNIKPCQKHGLSINELDVDEIAYNALEQELRKYDSEKFRIDFRKETVRRHQKGISYSRCWGLPFFSLIDATGDVIPCNLFYDNPKFSLGNLNEKRFKEIWDSEQRKRVLGEIKVNNCYVGCRLHALNEYLNRVKNPLPHDNFI